MLPECPVCSNRRYTPVCEVTDRILGRTDLRYRIYRCGGCGLGRTEPFPSAEEIPSLYPDDYSGDVEQTVQAYLEGKLKGTSSWRAETEKVRLLESYIGEGRILDVGCAEGKFLWALNPRRWDRVGLEFNPGTIRTAARRISRVSYIHGDLSSPLLEIGSFDAVTFWHVLEHLPDPVSALARSVELLKPGGILIVSLPNLDSLQAEIFGSFWYAFDDVPRHLYHFTPSSLRLLLEKAGLNFADQQFFSRNVNFHCWKHSLLNWCEDRFGNRRLYYLLKPILAAMPLLEAVTGRPGIFTQIARRPDSGR